MKAWIKKHHKGLFAAALYVLYAAVWLAVALVRLGGDGTRAPVSLNVASAEAVGMARLTEDSFLTENADPQLIFSGINAEVRLVQLAAAFSLDPGELELFYTRPGDADFSAAQRAIGVPQNDGTVLYALPGGTVAALRLDPGTRSGSLVTIQAVQLNPRLPASHYLLPTLRDVAGFALWPALALCVFYTILESGSLLARIRGKRAAARSAG